MACQLKARQMLLLLLRQQLAKGGPVQASTQGCGRPQQPGGRPALCVASTPALDFVPRPPVLIKAWVGVVCNECKGVGRYRGCRCCQVMTRSVSSREDMVRWPDVRLTLQQGSTCLLLSLQLAKGRATQTCTSVGPPSET